MTMRSFPQLPPPRLGSVALSLVIAPRAVIVYTPPPAPRLPQKQAIIVQQVQELDVEWIDVYQFRLPTDAPESCYIASFTDLGETMTQVVHGGYYTTVQIRLARLPRHVYDAIPAAP